MTQLKGGSSLADIASAQGKTEQSLIDQLVSASSQRIDQEVSSGKLTQDQADQMKAKLSDQIKNRVEHKGAFGGDQNGNRGGQFKEIATLLGVDQQEIMTQLKAGQSLVDIAATKQIDEQQIIDQLVSSASQRIDQEVTSGKITQDQADQMKAKLPDRIKQMVEQKGFGQKQDGQHQWKHKAGSNNTTSDNQSDSTSNQ
jgi:ribosomal protein S20